MKVLDKNRLFSRPILDLGDGYYDRQFKSDTKRDRIGNQGFLIHSQLLHLKSKVIPNKGSIDGGYTVDIIGSDFKDDVH